jgi:WD40 repeat protein
MGPGKTVLAGMQNRIILLNLETGKVEGKIATKGDFRAFGLTPDGKRIVLRESTEARVCSFPSLERSTDLEGYCNQNHVAVSRDGRYVAVNGHEVHVFELPSGKHVTTFEPPTSPWAAAFSPDSKILATGGDDGKVRLYDVPRFGRATELDIAPERTRKPTVNSIAFDPQGRRLCTSSEDGAVKVWDLGTRKLLLQIDKHETAIPDTGARQLAQAGFSPSGELIVSAGLKKEPVGLSVYRLPS